MYQDYSQYIQWLQQCVQAQERRIAQLEQLVKQMAADLKQLKDKPPIHVGTIEYKFDQLKIETVEGTLNIGLNPSDLQGIEDLAINQAGMNMPVDPKAQMQRSMEIEDSIYNYLETDLPNIITETQMKLNIQPNDAYLSFIKEDIKKQLPSRIDFHLKAAAAQNRTEENDNVIHENILHAIKQEIQNGVLTFFQHLPENMKGMNQQ
ncbi:spore germination protein GerPC [Neobacillus sp. PS3-12]|jgi:spore germination protein PC|uniref:spore germination protein GerPC n=1 Tax=Neobacillus sp. PS3-12 TaxID=3070677 RepID=UPI0027E119E2|nr:spore germination protein GerPC [Neobacillus sp. PS3-12]WML51531.1 spore germination protein GerPC [Neobacillus sp. PS3-12]